MLAVGDVVEGSDLFPGTFQVDEVSEMDGVPTVVLVPEGCVGIGPVGEALGVGQEGWLFAMSEVVRQDDGSWLLIPDTDGPFGAML